MVWTAIIMAVTTMMSCLSESIQNAHMFIQRRRNVCVETRMIAIDQEGD